MIKPPSRGLLLKSFLAPPPSSVVPSVHDYLGERLRWVDEYEGFNVLLFKLPQRRDESLAEIGYLSNKPEPTHRNLGGETKRWYGLSNTPFTEPWPKVKDGEQRMSETLKEWEEKGEGNDQLVDRMMGILQYV